MGEFGGDVYLDYSKGIRWRFFCSIALRVTEKLEFKQVIGMLLVFFYYYIFGYKFKKQKNIMQNFIF